MKINEIFNPDENDVKFDDIMAKCSQILQAYNTTGKLLYRGLNSDIGPKFFSASPKNRTPMNMYGTVNDFIEEWFNNKKFVATRSNSIFATSNFNDAENYALDDLVYVIFPIDGFKFTWASQIEDLWHAMPDDFDSKHIIKTKGIDDLKDYVFKIMDKGDFRQTDLNKAITSGNEVLIHGEYYGLHYPIAHRWLLS